MGKYNGAATYFNRDQFESNLSVSTYLDSKGAIRMPTVRAEKRAPTGYVCRLAPTSSLGQPESRPDPEAGPKGISMLT